MDELAQTLARWESVMGRSMSDRAHALMLRAYRIERARTKRLREALAAMTAQRDEARRIHEEGIAGYRWCGCELDDADEFCSGCAPRWRPEWRGNTQEGE